MDTQTKIADYLQFFERQREAGLLVLDDENEETNVLETLELYEYRRCRDWRDALDLIARGEAIVIELDSEMPRELYQLLRQYRDQGVMLQVQDGESLELRTAHYDPRRSRVLCVSKSSQLGEIERRYPIKDQVGLIERF